MFYSDNQDKNRIDEKTSGDHIIEYCHRLDEKQISEKQNQFFSMSIDV